MVCLQTLVALSVFAGVTLGANLRHHVGLSHNHIRATKHDGFAPLRERSLEGRKKRSAAAGRCASRSSTTSSIISTTTTNVENVGGLQTATVTKSSHSASTRSSSSPATTTTKKTTKTSTGDLTGAPVIPADWPTTTAAGATWPYTVATDADPDLMVVSEALDNTGVDAYNAEHSGDLTYYETGQVACGDYYTEDTWTAAVSHIMWQNWPGSDLGADTDRATICGPYVTGRKIINNEGTYSPVKDSNLDDGYVIIGGDGKANCPSSVGLTGKCHIPLTATITNPANGKSCVVQIVDECAGCAENDIDVTETVFSYLSDISLGRVPITWKFNHF